MARFQSALLPAHAPVRRPSLFPAAWPRLLQALHDHIVRRLAELDALDDERREAEGNARDAARRLQQLQQINSRLQAAAAADGQPGSSAAHARLALESQLRQARARLFTAGLDSERRRRNIQRMRAAVGPAVPRWLH